jgi:hypothetical protein
MLPNTSLPPVEPLRCPLCSRPNLCAVADGRPAEECWCMHATLDPHALQNVPSSARGMVCICPGCGLPTLEDTNDGAL